MRGVLDALQVMTVGSAGILTGAQIYVAVSVIPAMREFSPELSVRLHQELLTWRPGRAYKPLTSIALAAALGSVIVIPFVDDVDLAATMALWGLALVALSIYAYITLGLEFPINREVRSWERGTVPDGYAELRAHWDSRQRTKVLLVGFAFVCSVAGMMISL